MSVAVAKGGQYRPALMNRHPTTFESNEDAHAGSPEDIAGQTLVDDARMYTGTNPGGGQGRASDIQGAGPPPLHERRGMGRAEYRAWQDRLRERGDELAAIQGSPDINMPTTARQLGQAQRPLTTTMGVDRDIPLPKEMGRFNPPSISAANDAKRANSHKEEWQMRRPSPSRYNIERSEAFDHAMDMLESRYFG